MLNNFDGFRAFHGFNDVDTFNSSKDPSSEPPSAKHHGTSAGAAKRKQIDRIRPCQGLIKGMLNVLNGLIKIVVRKVVWGNNRKLFV